ncbi:hypothetical protein [Miniphocaeibacter halophilus]|uniref:Uncharacterized protein n=1 Tax=Miniphocaeibacter halophilus TaxID=2931922 RepID=A0AC61N028_9FIRM|nr:hypothetical protein [Miniphocaeibacter halophilus]QQK08508.1 hypothetical protein JFY71_02930 [Miniphocaeibacter halophilus]
MNLKSIKNRIYADYFMPSRLDEYNEMLKEFINNDFKFITIDDYHKNRYGNDEKIIILRHDIDSDLKIARKMFEIEDRYNIKSTYYFRLKTIDIEFMKHLSKKGIEVGYHFEEIATFAKKNKLKTKEEVYSNLNRIVEEFEKNLMYFKDLGIDVKSVSSHGDWKNRELDVRNLELINDNLLKKFHIIEAYSIEDDLDFRIMDNPYPTKWVGGNPREILQNNYKKSLLLVHPRSWDSCFHTRLKEDLGRLLRK